MLSNELIGGFDGKAVYSNCTLMHWNNYLALILQDSIRSHIFFEYNIKMEDPTDRSPPFFQPSMAIIWLHLPIFMIGDRCTYWLTFCVHILQVQGHKVKPCQYPDACPPIGATFKSNVYFKSCNLFRSGSSWEFSFRYGLLLLKSLNGIHHGMDWLNIW